MEKDNLPERVCACSSKVQWLHLVWVTAGTVIQLWPVDLPHWLPTWQFSGHLRTVRTARGKPVLLQPPCVRELRPPTNCSSLILIQMLFFPDCIFLYTELDTWLLMLSGNRLGEYTGISTQPPPHPPPPARVGSGWKKERKAGWKGALERKVAERFQC